MRQRAYGFYRVRAVFQEPVPGSTLTTDRVEILHGYTKRDAQLVAQALVHCGASEVSVSTEVRD